MNESLLEQPLGCGVPGSRHSGQGPRAPGAKLFGSSAPRGPKGAPPMGSIVPFRDCLMGS